MRIMYALPPMAALLLQSAYAINLFVSSYDGNLTTLSLTGSGSNTTLKVTSRDTNCGPQPSWLVYDKPQSALYCLDENWNFNTSSPTSKLTSYVVASSGELKMAQTSNLTAASSVNGVMFGNKSFMAVAGYSGQLTAVALHNSTSFKQVQKLDFVNKTALGPGQLTPHPHQTTVDPTGQYIVVPDLGGDILRVFCWENVSDNNILLEHPSYKVQPGSGPRHAAFWTPKNATSAQDNTYLFVVAELASTITTYKVTYPPEGGLNFTQLNTQNTFGNSSAPAGAKAAEIQISPDNKYLTVSNRNDSSFTLPIYNSVYSNSSTQATEPSDSLATYEIGAHASLKFSQIWPAGGTFPRQFAMNKKGDLVAVGLQTSFRVVILRRYVKTGLIGGPVAEVEMGEGGAPTCIVWDE